MEHFLNTVHVMKWVIISSASIELGNVFGAQQERFDALNGTFRWLVKFVASPQSIVSSYLCTDFGPTNLSASYESSKHNSTHSSCLFSDQILPPSYLRIILEIRN